MAKKLNISEIDNLLVIVPHQDDEVLLGAGLIYEMIKQEKKVTVAIVTNGDYECKDYSKGRARLQETINGMKTLGLSQENIIFLGYADTGMDREESFLTALYRKKDEQKIIPSFTSEATYGLDEKQDFHFQCFGVHGSYNRNTLKCDLRGLIKKIQPDCILTTHHADMHGDHEALFYFIEEVLNKEDFKPHLLVGLIHSPEGDDTWPLRDTSNFTCPKGLEEKGLLWEERLIFPLREEMKGGKKEGNLKYEALKKYEIALEPNAVDYLMSFIKDEEIYWKIR